MATDIEPSPALAPQIARVYLRVSTDAQDLRRQDAIVAEAKEPPETLYPADRMI